MKLKIVPTAKFKKDLKLINKRGLKLDKLTNVVNDLAAGKILDNKYRDHSLTGNYIGYRECHIQPDWLLVYKINETELILLLSRTGTHSDIF